MESFRDIAVFFSFLSSPSLSCHRLPFLRTTSCLCEDLLGATSLLILLSQAAEPARTFVVRPHELETPHGSPAPINDRERGSTLATEEDGSLEYGASDWSSLSSSLEYTCIPLSSALGRA